MSNFFGVLTTSMAKTEVLKNSANNPMRGNNFFMIFLQYVLFEERRMLSLIFRVTAGLE
jgi:hypothetical protein